MKITFRHTESQEINPQNGTKYNEIKANKISNSYGAVFGRNTDKNWIADAKTTREKGKTFGELQQEAGNTDVALQQDYKILLSHTMSAEDYAKMEEDGFSFSAMNPEEAVTIVDKIKAELARSGQHIAGYTDDLNRDTLAAALGSEVLAGAVQESFQEADIPLTEENISGIKKAWDMASQLNTPTDAAYQYMVENEMDAQVWDFYRAQSSGATRTAEGGQPKFYAQDIPGYYMESAAGANIENLQGQIDNLLAGEGLANTEENRQAAKALLEGGVAITGENISRLQELKSVEFPVTEEVFAKAVAVAVSEGKDPIYSNLARGENIYDKAGRILDYFMEEAGKAVDLEDIVSRRQLEEIRLRMTAEINVKLLKSGFAIDTAPMEELVEALQKAEAELAAKYFPDRSDAVDKYHLMRQTNEVIKQLPNMPASLLGPWSVEGYRGSLAQFHEEGKALKDTYEKAQTSYETLMTSPRKDLGDSIRKAFANVDDILQDLGMEAEETNRRAVRILGYNRMTIDSENIQRVQAADKLVQDVMEKMTPASVLKMIRDQQNPLEMSFEQLDEYFAGLPEEYEDSAESYSRFLYGLEQNHQITEGERSAYIGIYRMLRQIEASDGAAVGTLVNVGAEIHFNNLLSAVRSGKFKSMDVTVSDEFGATVERISRGERISDQIAKGFINEAKEILTEVSQTKEAQAQYQEMELQQLRQAATVDSEAVEMLIRGQVSTSAENLLAAQALADASYNPFKEWKTKKEQFAENRSKDIFSESALEHMDNKETMQAYVQELVETAQQDIQEISVAQTDSVDVRSMKLLYKQLSVAAGLSRNEEYIFPMYIGEELAQVHLTLENGKEERGVVDIFVALSEEEQLEAHLYAENGKITGFLAGNTEEAVMKLEKASDIFTVSVKEDTENDWEIDTLPIINRQENAIPHRKGASVNREVPGEETHREVNNTELYRIAKKFLEAVR